MERFIVRGIVGVGHGIGATIRVIASAITMILGAVVVLALVGVVLAVVGAIVIPLFGVRTFEALIALVVAGIALSWLVKWAQERQDTLRHEDNVRENRRHALGKKLGSPSLGATGLDEFIRLSPRGEDAAIRQRHAALMRESQLVSRISFLSEQDLHELVALDPAHMARLPEYREQRRRQVEAEQREQQRQAERRGARTPSMALPTATAPSLIIEVFAAQTDLLRVLYHFVAGEFNARYGAQGGAHMKRAWLRRRPPGDTSPDPDLLGLTHIILDQWDDVFHDKLPGQGMREIIDGVRRDRNRVAHAKPTDPIPALQAYQAVERIESLLAAIGARGAAASVRGRKEALRSLAGQ